ncbi:unnamed protein product [Blepharisma stoltei]|uniref:Uncharacterized protein n=1 Tax=Blepharisma stoltei TaxID=1481888 RepID=A0AAU9JGF9_9CILI|nr:unnamed protein product [Blepharisma stoltei]
MESNGTSTSQLLQNNLKRTKTPVNNRMRMSILEFTKTRRTNSQLPTSEEIKQMSSTFLASKKRSSEISPDIIKVKSERTIKLPRLKLKKALDGLNTGENWFKEEEELDLLDHQGATRFSSRPMEHSQRKLFPSAEIKVNEFPQSISERFGQIDPNKDQELANYLVNSKNAFKTNWSKHMSLKNRKFYPNTHPEFYSTHMEFNKKSDNMVEFREAMLLCKNMMKEAWSVKK